MLFEVILFHTLIYSGFAAESGGEHGGGGGHEAAAPGAAPKETFESGRQSMEWVELVNKVQTAKGRVEAQRAVILQLIEQKKTIDKQEALTKQIQMMSEENKKLNKLIDDYEEQRSLLQYRFPEKGITELRKYDRVEKKSIEDFETEISVEGQLNKNFHKMKKQYKGPKNPESNKKNLNGGSDDKSPETGEVPLENAEGTDVASPHSEATLRNNSKKKRPKVITPEDPADSITRSIKIIK